MGDCRWCEGRGTFGAGCVPCFCTIGTGPPRAAVTVRTPRRPSSYVAPPYDRPRTRGDCEGAPRPCPFVACRYNLYLEVAGRDIKFRHPHLLPHQVPPEWSCALDVAERGGATLEEVGASLNVTRERARQVEASALKKLAAFGVRWRR